MGLRRLFLLLTTFILTSAATVRADVYVADNFRADSIYAYPVKISKTDTVPDFNTRVPIACGDTLLCEVDEDGQLKLTIK